MTGESRVVAASDFSHSKLTCHREETRRSRGDVAIPRMKPAPKEAFDPKTSKKGIATSVSTSWSRTRNDRFVSDFCQELLPLLPPHPHPICPPCREDHENGHHGVARGDGVRQPCEGTYTFGRCLQACEIESRHPLRTHRDVKEEKKYRGKGLRRICQHAQHRRAGGEEFMECREELPWRLPK